MPFELVTVPALNDNYCFLLHDTDSGATALIDAPEAAAPQAALRARGWTLTEVWLTHHHDDHVQGLAELRAAYELQVTGAAVDAARLPPLDRAVTDGESFGFAGSPVHVMDVSGHTVGHIAFHVPAAHAVFSGDSLMAMGCGRLFEGSADQMWTSLTKLAALPGDTKLCSGHEYTQANTRFALALGADTPALTARAARIDAARAAGTPTVPSLLSEECETNPFLRATDPAMAAALGLADAPAAAVFAEIRARKDRF